MTSEEEREQGYMRYSARERFEGATVVPYLSMPYPALGINREVVRGTGSWSCLTREWSTGASRLDEVVSSEAVAVAWAHREWGL